MKAAALPTLMIAILLGGHGCSKSASSSVAASARHEHHPPHGGTAIVLGNEAYHVELVADPQHDRMTAYVLDGEMENFVRAKAPAFEVVASVGGEKRPLDFRAMPNPATGETVGDSSQFEAHADWLKKTPTFDAV